MTQAKLQALCKEWQTMLSLADWDVEVKLVRHYDMGDSRGGEVTTLSEKRCAVISILDPKDYGPSWRPSEDQELTLVHELVHLHWIFVDTQSGTLSRTLEEQAVHATSKALLALKRKNDNNKQ